MVQLVEYIMENENVIYKYCRKSTKNSDTAWDLLQNTYLKAIMLPETEIASLKSYVMTMIKFNHINTLKSLQHRSSLLTSEYKDSNDDLDDDDRISPAYNINRNCRIVGKMELAIDTKKVLEIMDKVCYPAERMAIVHNLKTDDARSDALGKGFQSHKTSRRNGIIKIKNYLLGE